MFGKCALCGFERELRLSHLLPKFIFRWMRNTGGGFLRQAVNPNVRRQDGPKEHMLCDECEQRFSPSEKYFSEEIFYPYLNERKMLFNYDERLIYFLISVLWRVMANRLSFYKKEMPKFSKMISTAEKEWRGFLLREQALSEYRDVHLFITDVAHPNGTQPVRRFNSYFARNIDATVAANDKECAVFAKFSRFFIFGLLTPYDETLWVNTKIENGSGILTIPQELRNPDIGAFLVDRAKKSQELVTERISQKQRDAIGSHLIANADQVVGTDLWKVMEADFSADVVPTMFRKKIGRNEPCPCDSGRKYKKCHGA